MVYDTLLADGVDLASLCIVENIDEFLSSPQARGSLPTFPGVNGSAMADRPAAGETRSLQCAVLGDNLTKVNDAHRALQSALRWGKAVTLKRRLAFTTGNEEHSTLVVPTKHAAAGAGGAARRLVVSLEMIQGVWYGTPPAAIGAGTTVIVGDDWTERLSIVLSAACTLTNTTNGWSMTVDAAGTVNVEEMTHSAGNQHLTTWNKLRPFRLDAGSNTITCSAGTAAITYYPAYL